MAAKNCAPPEFRILRRSWLPEADWVRSQRTRPIGCDLTHLSEFAPSLAENSTPVWYVYCAAAEAGFDALVVRDRSQLDQLAEMYVLSRLTKLSIVTWRKGVDDPVREWGQLLAYLPDVNRRCLEGGGRATLLPSPSLSKDSFHTPTETMIGPRRTLGWRDTERSDGHGWRR